MSRPVSAAAIYFQGSISELVDISSMSQIGSPIDTSLLQTAQAQRAAASGRKKERGRSEAANRWQDLVDLKVAGVEEPGAIRDIPENDSEEAEVEHRERIIQQRKSKTKQSQDDDGDGRCRIDVTA